ncbi:hypothetical protein RCL1_004108 [Eukaryota sp. TZLM3-RCL]
MDDALLRHQSVASFINVLKSIGLEKPEIFESLKCVLSDRCTSQMSQATREQLHTVLPQLLAHATSTTGKQLLMALLSSPLLSGKNRDPSIFLTVANAIPPDMQFDSSNLPLIGLLFKHNPQFFYNELHRNFSNALSISIHSLFSDPESSKSLARNIISFCFHCVDDPLNQIITEPCNALIHASLSWLRNSISTPIAAQVFADLCCLLDDYQGPRSRNLTLYQAAKLLRKSKYSISSSFKTTINRCLPKDLKDLAFICTAPTVQYMLSLTTFLAIKECINREQRDDTLSSTLHEEQVFIPYSLLSLGLDWKEATPLESLSQYIPPLHTTVASFLISVMLFDAKRRKQVFYSQIDRKSRLTSLGWFSLTNCCARILLSHYIISLVNDTDFLAFDSVLLETEMCLIPWAYPVLNESLGRLLASSQLTIARSLSLFIHMISGVAIKSTAGMTNYYSNTSSFDPPLPFSPQGFLPEALDSCHGAIELCCQVFNNFCRGDEVEYEQDARKLSLGLAKLMTGVKVINSDLLEIIKNKCRPLACLI